MSEWSTDAITNDGQVGHLAGGEQDDVVRHRVLLFGLQLEQSC